MTVAQDTPDAVVGCPAARTSKVRPFWNKTQKPTWVRKVILYFKGLHRLWSTCLLEKKGSTTKINIRMMLPSIPYKCMELPPSLLQLIQAVTHCKEVWLLTTQAVLTMHRVQATNGACFPKREEMCECWSLVLIAQLMITQSSYWFCSLPSSTRVHAIQ